LLALARWLRAFPHLLSICPLLIWKSFLVGCSCAFSCGSLDFCPRCSPGSMYIVVVALLVVVFAFILAVIFVLITARVFGLAFAGCSPWRARVVSTRAVAIPWDCFPFCSLFVFLVCYLFSTAYFLVLLFFFCIRLVFLFSHLLAVLHCHGPYNHPFSCSVMRSTGRQQTSSCHCPASSKSSSVPLVL
jgi:hypothetical protein